MWLSSLQIHEERKLDAALPLLLDTADDVWWLKGFYWVANPEFSTVNNHRDRKGREEKKEEA